MVQLRDAASLILLRQMPGGPHVLMGIRNAGHKFMPNRMVFPGGGVDAEDFSAPVASPLPDHANSSLQRAASPALANALAVAATRELQEETGLSLGSPPPLAGLTYLCRAETPADYAIRFNARFFLADGQAARGELAGSGELESLAWYDIAAILQLPLATPTRKVLGQLQNYLALDEAARRHWPAPALVNREWRQE